MACTAESIEALLDVGEPRVISATESTKNTDDKNAKVIERRYIHGVQEMLLDNNCLL